ncbi:hypothetical protein FGG08_005829 [Glutinoglossum americanum]|uniref:ATP-dependent bile acid permease n=1 Tax=Glutinoglossum americanum TaxID=1670608 RepID=A0A9P8I6J7_9PEZI|nr:hypothetical protein FGG08_005829 [Glutinoglossum americanum]
MFAGCTGPAWQLDDFTRCFEREYLQIFFPLFACGASFSFLSIQAIRRTVKLKTVAYDKLRSNCSNGNVLGVPGRYGELEQDAEDDDDDEDYFFQNGHVSLPGTRSQANGSTIQIDRPRGEVLLVAVEELAVIGMIAINFIALWTQAWGPNGTLAAIAGLTTWSYILILSSLRLMFSSSTRHSFPKIWGHTAFLYGFNFLFTVMLFRSAVIHPRSRLAQSLMISDFALVTLLFVIAISTRKGNKAVVLEYEDGLQPSSEPLASVLSLVTFSWVDAIVWKGYRKTFEMADVWNLIPKDKATYILRDFRQAKKTSKLAWHLLKYFRRLLLVQSFWACFSGLFTFAPTLLLRAILRYVEDPRETPINAAWLYVILLFVSGCVQALADGQALWIGRKICMRLRAVIIGEVYSKALRRKAAAGNDTVLLDGGQGDPKAGLLKRVMSFGRKKKVDMKDDSTKPIVDKDISDSQVNVGTIINLMAVDSFKVAEVSAYLHLLWGSVPIQIIVAVTLLYMILGLSSIAGIGAMLLLLPINIVIARRFRKIQKRIMAATDGRINSTNEVLQNIRIIKFFAWEERFGHIVNDKRAIELRALRSRYMLWAAAATIWYGAPIFITLSTFFIYTVIEKRDLIPSVAFTALSLFNILRVPLDQLADMLAHVQESKVSVDRVEEFLNEEETEKYKQLKDGVDESGDPLIGFENASFTWGSRQATDKPDTPTAFRLIDLDVKFHVDELNVVAGPTGSGKTSLLMALLGEMTPLGGTVYLPGGKCREDLKPNPETKMTESVAYCAQQAWLVNDTVKENILFASPFDEKRYRDVLEACALTRDLKILDLGDQTLVGEKGITLSGGQKQRISLARAIYSNSRHLILDDCLSAVDSHTGKWIFNKCILGPLMYNRTCVLVTHNIALCIPRAQHVIVLDNGRIVSQGPPAEVIASGCLGEDIQKSRPPSRVNSEMSTRAPSDLDEGESADDAPREDVSNGVATGKALNGNAVKPVENTSTGVETKAEGGVKWKIIFLYLSSMGRWYFWVAAVLVFVAQQVGSIATSVWIRQWANQYTIKGVNALGAHSSPVHNIRSFTHSSSFSNGCFASGSCAWNLPFSSRKHNPSGVSASTSSDVDVGYYLGIYGLLGLSYMCVSLMREAILFGGSLTASWKLHKRLLEAVTRAKFRFFDSTPLGQLMNRFSKDIESVDQEIAPVALGMVHCLASVVSIVILISVITPGFLIAGFFISAIYFFIGRFYIRSSRDLKRLESVMRSPLYQQFGETLAGITTIRAYGDERRFIRDNLNRVDTHNRPFIYLWATNRWLSFRVDTTGALVSFFAGVFVILSVGRIDAGAAGLSLTYAVTFTENVLWLVRLYAVNEQNMNSVERIKEYLDVDQEARAVIPESRPAANWPSEGSVEFINYTTRYRDDLGPVLSDVSFSIKAQEKVGIVGRTGAGKSSLALALFRGLEAEGGKILIDDVDIGLIGLQDLRESITIVPQDPTLFTGTIRSNLDPFGIFTDGEIFTALRRVQLIGTDSDPGTPVIPSSPTTGTTTPPINQNIFLNLASPVASSGDNLSQGQKQLVCLARALLRSPKVLLMDEATASIDYATDAKIQTTIRGLGCTTITIAHRLQTVVDCDKVLVLEGGVVKEYGHPFELLGIKGGVFRGMCESSGEVGGLEGMAKSAWEGKKNEGVLVDVSVVEGDDE